MSTNLEKMMKYTAIAMIFGSILGTAGCDDEGDIGLDPAPITCTDSAVGEATGTVTDPFNGNRFEFGEAAVTLAMNGDTAGLVTLSDNTILLRFAFLCEADDPGSYDVYPGTSDFPDDACPLAVGSNVLGQIEILPADSGVLVVDQNEGCLAGRFDVDFGEYGALSGWFSAPLPAP